MKALALIVVLAVTAVLMFSAVDAGRQAVVAHRAAQAQVLGF